MKKLDESKLVMYAQQPDPSSPVPKFYIKYDNDGAEVPKEVVEMVAKRKDIGIDYMKNPILMLKEAVKYVDMNYVEFEMI